MKTLLLKTNTRISANICQDGLNLTVKSPEIGELLNGGESLATFLFDHFDEMESSGGQAISFDDLCKYFVAPKDEKKEYLAKIVSPNFWMNIFRQIKRKNIDMKIPLAHEITISKENFLYHRQQLNLSCLLDPEIAHEKNFLYSGIYTRELLTTQVLPLLRIYSSCLIKNFHTKVIEEYPHNRERLDKENVEVSA